MKKHGSKKLNSTLFIPTLLIIITVFLSACSKNTYSGNFGDIKYSFQYGKDTIINPLNPFSSSYHPGDSFKEFLNKTSAYIEITKEPSLSNQDLDMPINEFISSMNNSKYLSSFHIGKTEDITISGIAARDVDYFYFGYTTIPIPYYGKYLCFKYKENIIKINIVYPDGWDDTEKAFDLLVKTFRIED